MGATQAITSKSISLRYFKSQNQNSSNEILTNCYSVSSQDNNKGSTIQKIAVLGIKPAVGKTAFISSFINQQPTVNNLTQTFGLEVKCTEYESKKIQFWEFESTEQSYCDLDNCLNDSFNIIIIIFESLEFELLKSKIGIIQKICNENKMTGKVPIYLVGNDKLDMKISGKENEIQKILMSIYDGNKIFVSIIDFRSIKELNRFFSTVLKN